MLVSRIKMTLVDDLVREEQRQQRNIAAPDLTDIASMQEWVALASAERDSLEAKLLRLKQQLSQLDGTADTKRRLMEEKVRVAQMLYDVADLDFHIVEAKYSACLLALPGFSGGINQS